jgi:hypothetical protein
MRVGSSRQRHCHFWAQLSVKPGCWRSGTASSRRGTHVVYQSTRQRCQTRQSASRNSQLTGTFVTISAEVDMPGWMVDTALLDTCRSIGGRHAATVGRAARDG